MTTEETIAILEKLQRGEFTCRLCHDRNTKDALAAGIEAIRRQSQAKELAKERGEVVRPDQSAILGIPEGRPGIWLIDAQTAEALIHAKAGSMIHNFIGHDSIMVGADWTKEDAVGLVHSGFRLAMIFPPCPTYKHQLVVMNDEKRWAFDVGEIDESRMTGPRCEKHGVTQHLFYEGDGKFYCGQCLSEFTASNRGD